MTDPAPHELTELLDALVTERLTPEQHARLSEQLQTSADARQEYFRYIDLHLGLKSILGAPKEVDPNADTALRLPAAARPSRSRPSSTRNIVLAVSAVAATIVLALVGGFVFRQQPATAPTGELAVRPTASPSAAVPAAAENVRLAGSAKGVLFGELTPAVGSSLRQGHEYALVEGELELAFPAGASVVLRSPAAFVIVSPARLDLRVGTCSVHAPDGAQGFEVTTPRTRVVDLGTRFSVKVHESGDSDVQVVEGAAEVHETDEPRADAVRLGVGEARRYSRRGGDQDRSREIPYREETYDRGLADRVISYRASKDSAGRAENLESVRVQRGGIEREYPLGELIGTEIVHFRSGLAGSNLAVRAGFQGTAAEAAARDDALMTGLINPGGAREPLSTDPVLPGPGVAEERLTPGLAFRFDRPVINSAGPDVVLFELQSAVYPPQGDAFHLSPVHFEPGLRSHTVRKFDITMASSDALPIADFAVGLLRHPPRSLEDLKSQEFFATRQTMQFRALAVGVDLSDLGYPAGAAVDRLFLQDAVDDQHTVDPVWIGGFPPVPPDKPERSSP